MPDFWTHILGGEQILQRLEDKQWQDKVRKRRKVFNFGCQGPDFFFYNDFWPWLKERRGPDAGRKIQQENVRELFLKTFAYLKEGNLKPENKQLLAVYLTGFLAHYALDKWCHPFIYARAGESSAHKRLEINLDTYLLDLYKGKKAYRISPGKKIDLGDNLPQAILEYYHFILHEVHAYPEDIIFVNQAYRDMKRVLAIFYSPRRVKHRVFKLLNPAFKVELSPMIYPEEVDPELLAEKEFVEFHNLFLQGVAEGVQLIRLMADYLQGLVEMDLLASQFPAVNFDGEKIE